MLYYQWTETAAKWIPPYPCEVAVMGVIIKYMALSILVFILLSIVGVLPESSRQFVNEYFFDSLELMFSRHTV